MANIQILLLCIMPIYFSNSIQLYIFYMYTFFLPVFCNCLLMIVHVTYSETGLVSLLCTKYLYSEDGLYLNKPKRKL